MATFHAKSLLDRINQQIDERYKSAVEQNVERTRAQEENTSLEQERRLREQNALTAKYNNQQHQRQNERIDTDKQRARDAERVLGREMYGRARQKVRS